MSVLEQLMRGVLAVLELMSHTSAASTDSDKVSHGKASAVSPPRTSSPVAWYRRRFDACRTDEERREVIKEALGEVRSLKYAKKLKGHESRELRIEIGLASDVASKVAHQYQCSKKHVYRCRAEVKKLPESVRREAKMAIKQADDPCRKQAS